MRPASSDDDRHGCRRTDRPGDGAGQGDVMHPTMMKLLGDARIQELNSEFTATPRPLGGALRRYRHLFRHAGGRS